MTISLSHLSPYLDRLQILSIMRLVGRMHLMKLDVMCYRTSLSDLEDTIRAGRLSQARAHYPGKGGTTIQISNQIRAENRCGKGRRLSKAGEDAARQAGRRCGKEGDAAKSTIRSFTILCFTVDEETGTHQARQFFPGYYSRLGSTHNR